MERVLHILVYPVVWDGVAKLEGCFVAELILHQRLDHAWF